MMIIIRRGSKSQDLTQEKEKLHHPDIKSTLLPNKSKSLVLDTNLNRVTGVAFFSPRIK